MAKGLRAQRKAHKQLLNQRAKRGKWAGACTDWRFVDYMHPTTTTTTYAFDYTDGTITVTPGNTGNVVFTTTTADTTAGNGDWYTDTDGRYWFRGV